MTPITPSARRTYALLAAVALAVFLLDAWRHDAQTVDDAYIALRYARNLAHGQGLVYNAGERVEGYTSLAFVLLAALFLRLGIAPILAWKALNLVAALATLVGAARLERAALVDSDVPPGGAADSAPRGPALAPPLSVLLLLPLPAFAYWAFGTLETMVFTALATWGLVLALREVEGGATRGAAIAFALAYLVRPEGAALFAVTTGVLALRTLRLRPDDRRAWSRHLANVAIVVAAVGLHLGWRLHYYGDWRPNTYYAKVTGGREQLLTGLEYARQFLQAFPVLALALTAPVLPRLARARRDTAVETGARAPLSVSASIALVALASILVTIGLGGDSQPFFRFFLPALPLLAALGAPVLRRLGAGAALGEPAKHAGAAIGIVLALFAVHLAAAHATDQPYRAFVADRTTRVGAAVGGFFAGRLGPGELIATNTAGSLPYASQRPALDTLGLTDASIAKRPVYIAATGWAGHRRGWGEYVLRRRPRAILFYNTAGAREPFYLGDRELLELPGFRFFYRLQTATLPALEDSISWPAARYLGFPFGRNSQGRIVATDLGLEARLFTHPLDYTRFEQGPVTVTWFERDRRDDALWSSPGLPPRDRVAAFVDAVAQVWSSRPPPPPADPQASARVDALCDSALEAIERGDTDRARVLLTEASAANAEVRSPRVFRYIANVAAMTADLHAALAAQKELVRLEPGDALARRNLVVLLTVPAAEFRARPAR